MKRFVPLSDLSAQPEHKLLEQSSHRHSHSTRTCDNCRPDHKIKSAAATWKRGLADTIGQTPCLRYVSSSDFEPNQKPREDACACEKNLLIADGLCFTQDFTLLRTIFTPDGLPDRKQRDRLFQFLAPDRKNFASGKKFFRGKIGAI